MLLYVNQKGRTFNVAKSCQKILNECGFAYIWNTQTFVDPNWLRLTNIRNLQAQFEQYWHSLLDDPSKAINYRLFKDLFWHGSIL